MPAFHILFVVSQPGQTRPISSHRHNVKFDGEFNVMSMGRNGSSWPGHWISTIAKIPSTEQDGEFNVMSMGRNGSSLAWLTNYEKYMECWHVFHLTCMY
jgi:hypothetical protein